MPQGIRRLRCGSGRSGGFGRFGLVVSIIVRNRFGAFGVSPTRPFQLARFARGSLPNSYACSKKIKKNRKIMRFLLDIKTQKMVKYLYS